MKNKEDIPVFDYNHLYLSSSGILYGLAKVRKPCTDRYSSLWSILPAINPPYTI